MRLAAPCLLGDSSPGLIAPSRRLHRCAIGSICKRLQVLALDHLDRAAHALGMQAAAVVQVVVLELRQA